MQDDNRIELEQAIIGAVVLETRYDQVGNILKPSNFTAKKEDTHANYQLIWSTIKEQAEADNPYDIITIANKLKQKRLPTGNYSYELALCTSQVNSGASLIEHAIILLETDIREKLVKQLMAFQASNRNINYRAMLQEILNHVQDPSEDIFDVVDSAEHYFAANGMKEEAEKMREFNLKVELRADQIRKNFPIINSLERLQRTAQLELSIPEKSRMQLSLLINGISQLLTTNQLNSNILNQLNELNS